MTGDKVKTFERGFADLHYIKYCIGVTNGTHAIEIALAAFSIKSGD